MPQIATENQDFDKAEPMLPTTPGDRIEDFLAFLRTVGPAESLSEARPATEEQVRRLVSLCPYPLPPLYLDWLRVFGGSERGMGLGYDCSFEVAGLIRRFERSPPADGFAPFALEWDISGWAFLYHPPGSPDHPVVISTCEDEPDGIAAGSFRNHLYHQVTVNARFPLRVAGCEAQLHHREHDLTPSVTAAAEGMGFRAYWFSDPFQAVLERGPVVLSPCSGGDGTRVFLRGPRADELRELADELTARFGFLLLGLR